MSVVANFLRRWSTTDINAENAFLFEEQLAGVRAIAEENEENMLEGLTRHSSRHEFAERYRKIIK